MGVFKSHPVLRRIGASPMPRAEHSLIDESFELSQHHSHVNENLAVATVRFVALVRVRHAQLASVSNLHRRADGAYESPKQIIKNEPIGTVTAVARGGPGVLPTLGLFAPVPGPAALFPPRGGRGPQVSRRSEGLGRVILPNS